MVNTVPSWCTIQIMGRRPPLDMVVYMYLNTITERVYIGSAKYGLAYRHKQHLKCMRSKRQSRFYKALASWPADCWERVVLEGCNTEEELDAAEKRWIAECCALDEAVGYNTYDSRYLRSSIAGGRAMQAREFTQAEREVKAVCGARATDPSATIESVKAKKAKRSAFKLLSPAEQQEFFRRAGQRGLEAARNKSAGEPTRGERKAAFATMSPDERKAFFSECGRRGAAKSKQRAST